LPPIYGEQYKQALFYDQIVLSDEVVDQSESREQRQRGNAVVLLPSAAGDGAVVDELLS
jgi:hypothetical protein